MKYLVLVIMGWLALAAQTQAASFDCKKAKTKVERIICDNAELSRIDEELAAAYKAALRQGTKTKAIVRQQKKWLKDLGGCTNSDCVKTAYLLRMDELTGEQTPGRVFTILSKDDKLCEAYKQYIEQEYRDARDSQTQTKDTQYIRDTGPGLMVWHWRDGPPMCMRPFGERYPEFNPVKWQEINPADYPELAGQAYRYIHDWPWARKLKIWQSENWRGVAPEPLTDAWFNEAAESIQEEHSTSWLFYFRGEADIDNDGHPETLLKVDRARCGWYPRQQTGDDKGPGWAVPIMVVDVSGKKIDTAKSEWILSTTILPKWEKTDLKGFHALGARSFDVFGFGGKIYFDNWEEEWTYNYRFESAENENVSREGYAALTVYAIERGVTSAVCRFKVNKFQII